MLAAAGAAVVVTTGRLTMREERQDGAAGVDATGLDADAEPLRLLRAGDEGAFAAMVARHHPTLIGLAMRYVPSRAVAEEVAQDAWIGFLRGVGGFEGRSSLQTWLYHILLNRARTVGMREHRHLASSNVAFADEAGRFAANGRWEVPPAHWSEEVIERLSGPARILRIRQLIDGLPTAQATVITLRDLDGMSSLDVCRRLGLSEARQRVLLHRARSRIRRALQTELDAVDGPRPASGRAEPTTHDRG